MDQQKARKIESDEIISCDEERIAVLAGPGCGKTWNFEQILLRNKTNPNTALATTFINELTTDLHHKLNSLAEVRTLHSLSQKILRKNKQLLFGLDKDFRVYADIHILIQEDFLILKGGNRKLIDQIRESSPINDDITFYLNRCSYYNAAGHDDLVYRVVLGRRKSILPKVQYKLILVDEFQDFNSLEVEFIENVLEANKLLLIAGDDDQAIYQFRLASSTHLVERVRSGAYYSLPLSYCSRCTKVVVDSLKEIINKAKSNGNLQNREDKKFECFMPKKGSDSEMFPKIIHAACTAYTPRAKYVPRYIESVLNTITKPEIDEANAENYPPALIIGDRHYLRQIAKELSVSGYDVEFTDSKKKDKKIANLFHALALLRINPSDNLAWRILLGEMGVNARDVLNKSDSTQIASIIDTSIVSKWLEVSEIASQIIRESDEIKQRKAISHFISIVRYSEQEIVEYIEKTNISDEKASDSTPKRGLWVKLVTHHGAKGLSGGRVFVVGFNNGEFPKNPNAIKNMDVCNLIIDITRTRKECHLISNRLFMAPPFMNPSVYLSWLGDNNVRKIDVNKDYFNNLS